MSDKISRRRLFRDVAVRSPLIGILGIHFHAYTYPAAVGWQGWLTWFGRIIGFVRLNGSVYWW